MATTGIVNGTALKIYVGGTAVAYTTSASLDLAMATRDISTKDSLGWQESAEGQRSGTISGDFLFAFNAAYGFSDLFTLFTNRTKVKVKLATSDNTDKHIEGDAYLTSLSKSAPMEDTISGSFTMNFTGAITFAT